MNSIFEKCFCEPYSKLINMANLLILDFIFYTKKTEYFKSSKHNTISVRTYKNYIQKFYKKRLTKIKFPKYLLFSFADSAYNHLSKILRDTINDIVPIHGTRIKGNTKPRFDSNVIELIRKRVILKESFLLIKLDIDYKQTILRNNCRKKSFNVYKNANASKDFCVNLAADLENQLSTAKISLAPIQ